MDDVTDTVFRQIIASTAAPDLFFTEFVNVDGLQSAGRPALLNKLKREGDSYPLIAQIWGKNPENFYKTTKDIIEMGFSGVDINFGCPEKNVVKNNCCSAMIKLENRPRALEIIAAVQDASAGKIPVSVKTRLGFSEIDLSWHTSLLGLKLNMLTIHARTRKEMSKVPPHWDSVAEIVSLRDQLAPNTKIVGNGDIKNRQEGLELANRLNLDGIMIGRGVFSDPYCFAAQSPWPEMSAAQKIELFRKHLNLHAKTWTDGERRFEPLKKFAKVYINGFPGANELRAKVMETHSVEEALEVIKGL